MSIARTKKHRPRLKLDRLPRHVAVIMDGNGRWAQRRVLPRVAGHTAGMARVKTIMTRSSELGLPVLSLYAFSTENWRRPKSEVSFLMNLVVDYMNKELQAMHKLGIRICTLGDLSKLPLQVAEVLEKAKEYTARNEGTTVNLALNYGSRAELTRAAASIARACMRGDLDPDEVTEETIASYLDTAGIPDPDLVIRTGGEQRLSNFLLFQNAYAEIYFTQTLWPDFSENEYNLALSEYQNRSRRFGGVSQ